MPAPRSMLRSSLIVAVALILAACGSGSLSKPAGLPSGSPFPDSSIPKAAIPSAARSAIAETTGVAVGDVLVHAVIESRGSLGVVATVKDERLLLLLRRVGNGYEVAGSKTLIPNPLVAGQRVFALETLDLGTGQSLVGGYVDPEMDRWEIIDRHGSVVRSGPTSPAFIAEAPSGSQLRVLTDGCAAFAVPATLPPVTDARLLDDSAQVQETGSRFVSLAGKDDAAAAALGAYGPEASWFPQRLSDVLDSVGFDVSTAEEEVTESSYSLAHPVLGQLLTVPVGSVESAPTVLGYELLGGCRTR